MEIAVFFIFFLYVGWANGRAVRVFVWCVEDRWFQTRFRPMLDVRSLATNGHPMSIPRMIFRILQRGGNPHHPKANDGQIGLIRFHFRKQVALPGQYQVTFQAKSANLKYYFII